MVRLIDELKKLPGIGSKSAQRPGVSHPAVNGRGRSTAG